MRWIEQRIAEAVSAERDRIADESKHIIKRAEARGADAEREACAKVCDELHWPWHMGDNSGPKECATAIRARSNT